MAPRPWASLPFISVPVYCAHETGVVHGRLSRALAGLSGGCAAGRRILARQGAKGPDARRLQADADGRKGVEEIRIRDDSGIYRVIYTARIAEAVFVLHAFQKKTQRTSQRDLEIAKTRFAELMRARK